jgi:hypothetical protein
VIIYEYAPTKLYKKMHPLIPAPAPTVLHGPPIVLKLDSKPISRVEVGFQGGKVYVFGLFREFDEVNGQKRERCSVRKVGLRAGVDWLKLEEEMKA